MAHQVDAALINWVESLGGLQGLLENLFTVSILGGDYQNLPLGHIPDKPPGLGVQDIAVLDVVDVPDGKRLVRFGTVNRQIREPCAVRILRVGVPVLFNPAGAPVFQ